MILIINDSSYIEVRSSIDKNYKLFNLRPMVDGIPVCNIIILSKFKKN